MRERREVSVSGLDGVGVRGGGGYAVVRVDDGLRPFQPTGLEGGVGLLVVPAHQVHLEAAGVRGGKGEHISIPGSILL